MTDHTIAPAAVPAFSSAGQERRQRAVRDLVAGATLWRLWFTLGWIDIRQRYRRALIGPFWITISMCVMVLALGVLYGSLLKVEVSSQIPYLAAGFSVWFFVQATISESATCFIQAEGIIRNSNLPLSIHVYRLVWRNFITFGHNVVVMLGAYAAFAINPGASLAWVVPGLLLVTVNLVWIALVIGIVCTRFRDTPPIITNLLQIAFFVTPILYRPALLGDHLTAAATWNPFFHLIEAVRAPLLGSAAAPETYLALAAFGLFGWAFAFLFYCRFRPRIAYWL